MFKEVSSQVDFAKQERETLKRWVKEGIIKKYLKKNEKSKKKFRFLDGPITANNPMGVHHAHGRTLKDFFQRYYNLKGYQQRFQNGFDCQGLWVEVEVEKDLGFNSKRQIEKYGLDKFSKTCRARVDKFSKVQAEQSQRLGMFMNWENSYFTMSERNNLYIWHFLKVCHQKGWLYKGTDSMPWCTRCGTAISQHELSDGGYRELKHESVYLKFPLVGEEDTFLLIWTTTPWTLLANVAVAVHPELKYQVWKEKTTGERLIMVALSEASDSRRLEKILKSEGGEYNPVEKILGKELIDKKYQGPFDELDGVKKAKTKNPKTFHTIIPAPDLVSADEGTGLVHIAPGAGHEDFELGQEFNLPIIAPLDEFGLYLKGFGEFSGISAHQVKDTVFKSLKKKKLFFKTEWIRHSYPCCWRCKEELVFRTTDEWFIKADEIRPLMKKASRKVNWMPDYAGKRMQDWLDNMGDWPISRRRYWGLALPFYECSCGELVVVGSKEELKKLAVNPKKVDQLPELHKPWIDEIKIKCPKCGKPVSRIADVGDCWLDAGIVPFSTVDYLTNKKYWQDWYPFEFITEYIAQVKLWFYATLFMSVALEGKAPWKNVLATGFVVDEKGEAMHKSKGNAIWFDDAIDKMGADVMRWIYLSSKASKEASDLRFGFNLADETRRKFHLILWNVYKYFVIYANLNSWKPKKESPTKLKLQVLDSWFLEKLDHLIYAVTESLDQYDTPTAAQAIEEFVIKDFSTWYVRLIRDRLNVSHADSQDKNRVLHILHQTLVILCRLLAPFTPFMVDEMYRNLTGEESVHLSNWPVFKQKPRKSKLLDQMAKVREIVELGHAQRKDKGVKLRQPLKSLTYKKGSRLGKPLEELVKKELNVKEVIFEKKKDELKVSYNFRLSRDLVNEGIVRELIRYIQGLRKDLGCEFNDQILIYYQGDQGIEGLIQRSESDLKEETLASRLVNEKKKGLVDKELKINDNQVWFGIKKK